jgi:HSP20 family protein
MSIIKWQPMNEAVTLRQMMDGLFDDAFSGDWHPFEIERTLVPPVDMIDSEKEITVRATLPGVARENVSIDVTGDTLTIKGETRSEKEEKKENYLYRESRHGTFSRALALPEGLQVEKAEAKMENGILTIRLPKAEIAKPKTVKVEIKKEEKTAEAEK